MAKPPRDYTSFGSNKYFITSSTWGNRSLFQTERMATLLIDVLLHYRSERKYLLHEFMVMPNHVHVLLSPLETLARAIQFIKGGFSYRSSKELGISMEIWERGTLSTGFGTQGTMSITSSTFGKIRCEQDWRKPRKNIAGLPQVVGLLWILVLWGESPIQIDRLIGTSEDVPSRRPQSMQSARAARLKAVPSRLGLTNHSGTTKTIPEGQGAAESIALPTHTY